MAAIVLTNAAVRINAVDLTDHVRSVTINYNVELLDKTAMTDGARSRIAGFKDFTASIEYNQDYASGSVDATHFPLLGSTAFTFAVWPNTTTLGAGNPKFSGTVVLGTYSPVQGSAGALNTVTVEYQGAGTLTRSTAY